MAALNESSTASGTSPFAQQFVYFDETLDKFCIDEDACRMLEAINEQVGMCDSYI